MVGVLEQRLTGHRDLDVRRQGVALAQITKLRQLPAETALIGTRYAIDALGSLGCSRSRILEGGATRIVIHKETLAGGRVTDFPARRQRALVDQANLLALCPRILPLGGAILVVHKVHPVVRLDLCKRNISLERFA